jgi:HK97 family phage portal protein
VWEWLLSWFRSTTREIELPAGLPYRAPLPAVADPSYATLYRSEPSVRICVDFLARNLAQLSLHLYRRLPDDSRIRIRDHPIITLLDAPNPSLTRFSLVEQLVVDLGIFGNAFWYVTETSPPQLLGLPSTAVAVGGLMRPVSYALLQTDGQSPVPLDPDRVIHVRYANPECPAIGLSPLASLKRRLTEEAAMDNYGIYFWRNYARLGGVIERDKDNRATPQQIAEFGGQWQESQAGLKNQGKTAVLPAGWTFKEISSTAREAQMAERRKATREEVAALYMIPLSMVGLLENANYANMHEQHRQLYTDCLPPLTRRIEQELMRTLFPLFSGTAGLYLEFNLMEKLTGSFEEQAQSLRASVGQPYLSVNEARARLNLPRIDDPRFDAPVIPLNVMAGAGQISDVNATPPIEADVLVKALQRVGQLPRTADGWLQ